MCLSRNQIWQQIPPFPNTSHQQVMQGCKTFKASQTGKVLWYHLWICKHDGKFDRDDQKGHVLWFLQYLFYQFSTNFSKTFFSVLILSMLLQHLSGLNTAFFRTQYCCYLGSCQSIKKIKVGHRLLFF